MLQEWCRDWFFTGGGAILLSNKAYQRKKSEMFERIPLRQHVQKEILARIGDNRLPAGTRINESHLSAALGLSRTPLREAMLGLEAVGFLNSDMGRGFMVPPILSEDFAQTQAVLIKMAPYALTLAGPLPPGQIMELSNLLGRSRMRVAQPGAEQGGAVAELIHRWCPLLIGGCSNKLLVTDIMRLETLSRRCWREAVSQGFEPSPMVASYEQLYEMLRTNHTAEAAEHWEKHIAQFSAEAARHLPKESEGSPSNPKPF